MERRFSLSELSGALGDLGALLPFMAPLIAINGLNATTVFVTVGAFYLFSGAYYRLPMPVQPFKVIGAVAVAGGISCAMISASALIMSAVLLALAATNLISPLSKLFSKAIIRGINLSLGLGLLINGAGLIISNEMFLSGYNPAIAGAARLNLITGVAALAFAAIFIKNRLVPVAMVLIASGIGIGAALGAWGDASAHNFGPPRLFIPDAKLLMDAFILMALPQIPLTIGNAVVNTSETAKIIFGEKQAERATPRALCFSMGAANMLIGFAGGMPCCHGSGGLAAHHRFGARNGLGNIAVGAAFIALGALYGPKVLSALNMIPKSILGSLLVFAGAELCLLLKDLRSKTDIFVAVFIAAVAAATRNIGIAFIAGIGVDLALRKFFARRSPDKTC